VPDSHPVPPAAGPPGRRGGGPRSPGGAAPGRRTATRSPGGAAPVGAPLADDARDAPTPTRS